MARELTFAGRRSASRESYRERRVGRRTCYAMPRRTDYGQLAAITSVSFRGSGEFSRGLPLQKEILLKLWAKKEAAKQVGPEGERFCFVRIEEIQGSHFKKKLPVRRKRYVTRSGEVQFYNDAEWEGYTTTPQWRAAYASTHRAFRRLVLRGLIKKDWGFYELTEEGFSVAATFAKKKSSVESAVREMRWQIKKAEKQAEERRSGLEHLRQQFDQYHTRS